MKTITFDVEFLVDGKKCGSGFVSIGDDGSYSIEDAEEEFYKTLRKSEKYLREEAYYEWKEKLIDNINNEQYALLKSEHAKYYSGTDDDMPDAYEEWIKELSYDDLKEILSIK